MKKLLLIFTVITTGLYLNGSECQDDSSNDSDFSYDSDDSNDSYDNYTSYTDIIAPLPNTIQTPTITTYPPEYQVFPYPIPLTDIACLKPENDYRVPLSPILELDELAELETES